jgi:hypothetical protein
MWFIRILFGSIITNYYLIRMLAFYLTRLSNNLLSLKKRKGLFLSCRVSVCWQYGDKRLPKALVEWLVLADSEQLAIFSYLPFCQAVGKFLLLFQRQTLSLGQT